jgi:hypothetical protein
MMSLAETNLWAVVKKQYIFKLQSYANLFLSLVIVQLIALLFTAGGMAGTSGIGWNNMLVEVKLYSGETIFIYTALWVMAAAFILTLPLYRNIDFSFVTNRLSSNMANIGFLVTASIAGGVTATLATLLLRNILYYIGGSENFFSTNFLVGPGEFLSGMAVAILYLLLFSAAGYFAGALIQLHRSLYVILPALLLGTFFYEAANEHVRIFRAFVFFTLERSPWLFFQKITISVLLLWICAILLSNRAEVR